MKDAALIGWGVVLGWLLATWKDRQTTAEHRLGEKLQSAARQALWHARIVGRGFDATHTATLNVDGEQLELKLTAPGVDTPERHDHDQ